MAELDQQLVDLEAFLSDSLHLQPEEDATQEPPKQSTSQQSQPSPTTAPSDPQSVVESSAHPQSKKPDPAIPPCPPPRRQHPRPLPAAQSSEQAAIPRSSVQQLDQQLVDLEAFLSDSLHLQPEEDATQEPPKQSTSQRSQPSQTTAPSDRQSVVESSAHPQSKKPDPAIPPCPPPRWQRPLPLPAAQSSEQPQSPVLPASPPAVVQQPLPVSPQQPIFSPAVQQPLQSPPVFPQQPIFSPAVQQPLQSPPVSPQQPIFSPAVHQPLQSPPVFSQQPIFSPAALQSPPVSPQQPIFSPSTCTPMSPTISMSPPVSTQASLPILREGYIQYCHGYLARKSGVLKRWKDKQLFTIVPGPQSYDLRTYENHEETLHSFPLNNPNIRIEPCTSDPKNNEFLGFSILSAGKKGKDKELDRFRADDIVQMRRFMASLGKSGKGLFSPRIESAFPTETTLGLWDVIHPSQSDLVQPQQIYESMTRKPQGGKGDSTSPSAGLPSYTDAVQQLPFRFYFPEDGTTTTQFPGAQLPLYDSSINFPALYRRPFYDTFRPPYGPPVFLPISIGYGAEVGLEPGIQVLWDPTALTYFFLDHKKMTTFYDDPRPPTKPQVVVKKVEHLYGDQHREQKLPNVCRDPNIVRDTANRARRKPVGFVLNASGVDGSQGPSGYKGRDGAGGQPGQSGHNGEDGQHGKDGFQGYSGTNGVSAMHGTPASDVIVTISGDADALQVSGRFKFVAKLGGTECKQVLLIDCKGGNGGCGGAGGQGGQGGDGGPGGHGATGMPGHNKRTSKGGNGGQGGNGGNGGNGGPGGMGGKGGDGGGAGTGGVCVINTQDLRLFVLVEADCMCGTIGMGGAGGRGGGGGSGAPGGMAGAGGPGGYGQSSRYSTDASTNYYYTDCGANGRDGNSGSNGGIGGKGTNGPQGKCGRYANVGGILWVVRSPEGKVLHQAATRYDAEIIQTKQTPKVISGINDGVFEPNERIMVSDVLVINSGCLPLPEGAQVFIPSTATIKFEPTRFTLPVLAPNQKFTVPVTFSGRLLDAPSPNAPGPFQSKASFATHIELLGRPFEKSSKTVELCVEYPVKLGTILRCKENAGRGEVSIFEVDVHNISSMPYGTCAGSGGEVVVQLHMDLRLIPVAFGKTGSQKVPYTVTYDPATPDSLYIRIHEIPPRKVTTLQVAVQVDSQAELLDKCRWQADLYLRGKLIEYNTQVIRISPFFAPKNPPADVLVVTDPNISRKEFVHWQHILNILNVSADFWDTGRYNGLSVDSTTRARHQVTWEGRYSRRLVLYPHCNLQMLLGVDIVRHFHGPNYRNDRREDFGSSMLLFMPPMPSQSPQADPSRGQEDHLIRHLALVDESLELPKGGYSGKHISAPKSSEPCLKWEKTTLEEFEKKDPSRALHVISRKINFESTGMLKYSYGYVDLRRCPILRSCKLVVVSGVGGCITDMDSDDMHLSPTSLEIPLAGNFGQCLLATLFGISLSCKLQLIKTSSGGQIGGRTQVNPTFYLPNGFTLTIAELAAICAAREIAEETISCWGTANRMNLLTEDVTKNVGAYTTNGTVVLQALQLVENEVAECKKMINNAKASQTASDIKKQSSNIQKILKKAGVDGRKLSPLPSLSMLQDNQRMNRSHQYVVKDERWNLAY